VVSRYVEIDLEEGDVSLETEDRVTALVANLPIKRAKAKATEQERSEEESPVWTAVQG
jgi:cell division topological specificity factor